MQKRYKVSGRFEVCNYLGNLVDGRFFLNKVFEADSPVAAKNKAGTYINRKKSKKYGKRATLSQIGNLVIRQYRGRLQTKKAKGGKQLGLF